MLPCNVIAKITNSNHELQKRCWAPIKPSARSRVPVYLYICATSVEQQSSLKWVLSHRKVSFTRTFYSKYELPSSPVPSLRHPWTLYSSSWHPDVLSHNSYPDQKNKRKKKHQRIGHCKRKVTTEFAPMQVRPITFTNSQLWRPCPAACWSKKYHDFYRKRIFSVVGKRVQRCRGELVKVDANPFYIRGELAKVMGE